MKNFILVLLFASCVEVGNDYYFPRMIVLSDSCPVQFWPVADSTFNEGPICGVTPVCFCTPFLCDQDIDLFFSDSANLDYYVQVVDENGLELLLEPFVKETTGGTTYYTYSLQPYSNSPSFCNIKLRAYVVTVEPSGDESEFVDNFHFQDDIQNFSPTDIGADNNWYHLAEKNLRTVAQFNNAGGALQVQINGIDVTDEYYVGQHVFLRSNTLVYNGRFVVAAKVFFAGNTLINMEESFISTDGAGSIFDLPWVQSDDTFFDFDGYVFKHHDVVTPSPNASYTNVDLLFNPIIGSLNSGDEIRIRAKLRFDFVDEPYTIHFIGMNGQNLPVNRFFELGSRTGSTTQLLVDMQVTIPQYLGADIAMTSLAFYISGNESEVEGEPNIVYVDYVVIGDSDDLIDGLVVVDTYLKSDCLHVKDQHDCTTMIEFSNSKNFDGILYETSPQPVFSILVPAQFWKENNPQTQEDLNLSDGEIVTLRQEIQEKTLLEVGYVPNYFHKKIQKILMHDEVTISGTQWKKRDSYESENIDRYPLKRATVWLTQYTSVERNTL